MSSTSWNPDSGILLKGACALGPVLVFLLVLLWLDSTRLVRPRRVFGALLAGGVVGLLGYMVNSSLMPMSGLATLGFAILVAPFVEETLKAAFVVWFLKSGRSGFLIDTAILGFAVGAGFSLLENLYYLDRITEAPWIVWIVRGFGTALMHGGCTAIFAVTTRSLLRDPERGLWRAAVPGLVLAALLHSSFNRAMVHPILTTATMLVILPGIFILVYRRGERMLRSWVGTGFDRDQELLALIRDGEVTATPLGRYLVSLRQTFPAERVADMFCLLRLRAELSIAAKGRLLLRQHGFPPQSESGDDEDLAARLEEVRWLERSVGRAGLLALRPVMPGLDRRRWERQFLRERAGVE